MVITLIFFGEHLMNARGAVSGWDFFVQWGYTTVNATAYRQKRQLRQCFVYVWYGAISFMSGF